MWKGTLKKLKDADPADFHHQDIVKQDIVTVTLTTTIETNLRQGDLETEVDGTKGDLTETETESNEALSEWEEGRIIDFLTTKVLWFACESASQKMFPSLF